MHKKLQQLFEYSILFILLLTALAKLFSSLGHAHLLEFPDPLLGLSNRWTLLLVSVVELAICGCLLSRLNRQLKYLLIIWLGSNFLLYRFALAILKPNTYCKCLGTLTDTLHLPEKTVGYILTTISLYLVLGGLAAYWRHSRSLFPKRSDEQMRNAECGVRNEK